KSRWIARFADAEAIEWCRTRFNDHASLKLLASRLVPGTRLPTYLAAGLLSMPLTRFALVTGLAAILWIGGIFAITNLLGSQALIWLSFVQSKLAVIFLIGLVLAATLFAFRRFRCAAVAGVGYLGCACGLPNRLN